MPDRVELGTSTIAPAIGASVDNKFLRDVMVELVRARVKFPDNGGFQNTMLGLYEETGELSEALLDTYVISEKYRKGKTYADVYKEAVQVAVMAMRVVLDCGLCP